MSTLVDATGTSAACIVEIAQVLRATFDLAPTGIIRQMDLLRPVYYPTAAYRHFGRDDVALRWEGTANVGAQL